MGKKVLTENRKREGHKLFLNRSRTSDTLGCSVKAIEGLAAVIEVTSDRPKRCIEQGFFH